MKSPRPSRKRLIFKLAVTGSAENCTTKGGDFVYCTLICKKGGDDK